MIVTHYRHTSDLLGQTHLSLSGRISGTLVRQVVENILNIILQQTRPTSTLTDGNTILACCPQRLSYLFHVSKSHMDQSRVTDSFEKTLFSNLKHFLDLI